MSDLFSRLSQRRKGISGAPKPVTDEAKNPGRTEGLSTMEKMAAIIPPPPLNETNDEENNASDGDWD